MNDAIDRLTGVALGCVCGAGITFVSMVETSPRLTPSKESSVIREAVEWHFKTEKDHGASWACDACKPMMERLSQVTIQDAKAAFDRTPDGLENIATESKRRMEYIEKFLKEQKEGESK